MKNPISPKSALAARLQQTFSWSSFRQDSALARYAFSALVGSGCALVAPLYPYSASVLRLLVDLASHFVWGYLVLAIFIFAVAKSTRARCMAFGAMALTTISLVQAHWSSLAPLPMSSADTALRVMSANVFVNNTTPDKLTELLARNKPDVVFVQEVSPMWAKVLGHLPAYPYRKVIARKDSFGIALLSKYPLTNIVVLDEKEFGPPAIAATMSWRGQEIELVAVHPLPPIGRQAYVNRNATLYRHATRLSASGRPAIMGGDFNATPWSAGLAVVNEAGLVRATPLAPTWPAHLGVPAVIPIDHIVVSKHWAVGSNGRGPGIGSDHFPVEATVYLKPQPK
jgi:endonuclease/exonuclease/phosphatase (EEP) superfamily protein YafD